MLKKSRLTGVMVFVVTAGVATVPSLADGFMGYLWGESGPPTLVDVARMIDGIQNAILNQGTVVLKQPDIWSQARMTMFRKEFEDTMSPEVANFSAYLSARVARSDAATLQSQTALAAVLTPFGKVDGVPFTPQITSQEQLQTALVNTTGLVTLPETKGNSATTAGGTGSQVMVPGIPSGNLGTAAANFQLLNSVTSGTSDDTTKSPLTNLKLGLEPNVIADEKADYLGHLHRIRRVNLGDDMADSAGYGLYLLRLPVSIQPGDKTKKGHGAVVNVTMRHDFGPKFLSSTYRNLVINDVIDTLGPIVTEVIRNGAAAAHHDAVVEYLTIAQESLGGEGKHGPGPYLGMDIDMKIIDDVGRRSPTLRARLDEILRRREHALAKVKAVRSYPVSRTSPSVYPIAPSDVQRVVGVENVLNLAWFAQDTLGLGETRPPFTNKVHGLDVGGFLRQEVESAYDLLVRGWDGQPALLQDVEYIESLTELVNGRKFDGTKTMRVDSSEEFSEFITHYESFTRRLPGNLRWRPAGVLCWAIAIESGLLNRYLRDDMGKTKGEDGYTCPPEVREMFFYPPEPAPEAESVFQEYVKARWPLITFALEPVTDQQNIEDSFTRQRDLQLAIAFALSAGRISFRQAIQYTRKLQYEAQTISLHRTVTSFAHGNDSFGWRFSPRYQTPPEESNLRAATNLLLRGGPGPNYQLKNSEIEPGQRELTAVVVMPSFVRGLRLDVAGDWFRLHDPDDQKIHTARTIELGQQINKARDALTEACTHGRYRTEDAERLRMRLHQLERMLPMQTQLVKVPYENTLGGFDLFTQGANSLVPQIFGFDGLEYIDPNVGGDIVLYGKDFSIYETAVIVGGVSLPREGVTTALIPDAQTKRAVAVSSVLNPLQTNNGNLVLLQSNGNAVTEVKDRGSFNILSREVMRVRVPGGVQTTSREGGTSVVELFVSTPNGISNRIAIPVAPREKPPTVDALKGVALTVIDGSLPVNVAATVAGTTLSYTKFAVPSGTQLRLLATGAKPRMPDTIRLRITFGLPTTPPSLLGDFFIENLKWDPAASMYVANADALGDFVASLHKRVLDSKLNLATDWTTRTIEALIPPDNSAWVPVANSLKMSFQITVPLSSTLQGGRDIPVALSGGAKTQGLAEGKPVEAARARDVKVRTASAEPPEREDLRSSTSPEGSPNVPSTLPEVPIGDQGTQTLPPLPPLPPLPVRPSDASVTPSPVSQTLVVVPSAPTPVRVSVPITNVAPAPKHKGIWRRRAQPTDPAAVRGPFLERLLGRP